VGRKFKVGGHVTWNFEAGHVSGRIIKVHKTDFHRHGYTRHASRDDPQYEIKSDRTDHIAQRGGAEEAGWLKPVLAEAQSDPRRRPLEPDSA
jgi:hypothetical protein